MKKIKHIWLPILTSIFFLIACNNDSEGDTFDTESQLEYIFDAGIESQINSVQERANSLKLLIERYNETPTATNFEDLKNSWKELILTWKPLEAVTIGDFALTSKVVAVHFWPFDVELLETNINSYTEQSFEVSATAKGLGAIEYILFSSDYDTFVASENHDNASAYLGLLINDLILTIDNYENEWLEYEEEFKAEGQTGVTGTQNQLLNKIVFTFFDIIVDKIQGPEISYIEGADILTSETPFSEFSLDIIEAQIVFTEALFSGNSNNEEAFVSIYDQLIFVGRQDLVEALQNQFQVTNKSISSANETLENLVISESEALSQIEENITMLHALISNDIFSALNITVTVGDNDGDS